MRLSVMASLILLCMIYVDEGAPCGVHMDNGLISSNCTGFFSLRHGKTISMHKCGEEVEKTLIEPVLVSVGNCSKVLLNHSPSAHMRKVDGYLIFWMSTSGLLLMLLVPMVVLIVFLSRTGTRGGREFIVSRAGIKLNSPISDHLFSWWKVLLIGLYLTKPSYEACVSPVSVDKMGPLTQLDYSLLANEEACLTTGRLTNLGAVITYSLTHLYNTSDWNHTTWTDKGCGYGNCGTEEECSHWGDVGKVVHKQSTVYLKQCRPHRTSMGKCFYKWGCWLSTKEVHYGNKEIFSIYQIGKPSAEERLTKSGSLQCTHSSVTDSGSLTLSHLILVKGREDWLCASWSHRGQPKSGMIGDLQVSMDSPPIFDFSSFLCETSAYQSSGNCEVISSGISSLSRNCLKLPAETDVGTAHFIDGEFKIYAGAPTRLNLLCSGDADIVHSTHDCYDRSVVLLGIKEEGSLQVLSFSAKSIGGNSTWVVTSFCFAVPFEVPCDGESHGHPILHTDPEKCTYSGIVAEDRRSDESGPFWTWDNPEHHSVMSETHAISITTIIIIAILLCLIKLVCH